VSLEPLSPELALIDPELRACAQAALPDRPPVLPRASRVRARSAPPAPPPAPTPAAAATPEPSRAGRAYPLWARVAATLWILVIGILVGGAAVPHAQDRPRVVPRADDALFCERPQDKASPLPTRPLGPTDGPRAP
jgi:hypothetical protein